MDHLRFSGKTDIEQRDALEGIVRDAPLLMKVLQGMREIGLPEWWIASGSIYNSVWNHLTNRTPETGIKDFDVIYFDGSDLSYEAEDVQISLVDEKFKGISIPIELRNQARTHIWYPGRFGRPYAALKSAAESLERYASKTHAVAVRLEADDTMTIFAPFGLDYMFSFKMVPNHVLENRNTHEEKGSRAKAIWPELEVLPW
ncbi:MAG: nucleotidyltransferase family protein [Rhizobiaceae bacterium]|nr:nucleotidyltransferase family protein [Rhizobiaceae bacterium]